MALFGDLDEARKAERERVRVKQMSGNASPYESHWLWCQDHNAGRYIPPESGPHFKEFGRDRQAAVPHRTADPGFKSVSEIFQEARESQAEPVKPASVPEEFRDDLF